MIKNIMTKSPICFKKEQTIKEALDAMINNNINGIPILDEQDFLIGMIVKADIYRFLIEDGHYDSCPIEWVMSKDLYTCKKEDSILKVCKEIRKYDIIAMPVIDDNKKVIGVISIEDLLDEYINYLEKE